MITKKLSRKEKHLNALYFDCLSEEQAVKQFIYLTNKSRTRRTTEAYIRKCYQNRELGSLLKRLDSIAYECSNG